MKKSFLSYFVGISCLLSSQIVCLTSCQSASNQTNYLTYGESIVCNSFDEINSLFNENKSKWPCQQQKTLNFLQEKIDNLNNMKKNKNFYFDLIASICNFSMTNQSINDFALTWDSSNDQMQKIVISTEEYNQVEYCFHNHKINFNLSSTDGDSNINQKQFPSFEYQNVSFIEG